MSKTTVVIGATPNADRYAYRTTLNLQQEGHKVYPVGIHAGKIGSLDIITDKPALKDIDTVTLYVGPANQVHWIDYILSLKPKRLVFNPGTENKILFDKALAEGIECIEACTLVMLSIGNY
jgi:predicted CoA-binding protein